MAVYTTHTKVAALLGVTLTAGQQALVTDDLEPAIRAYVDRYTGRSWGVSSPVTGEAHTVYGGVVYLKNRPVAAISAATYRSLSIGSDPTTLVVDSTYELLDAANGVVLVAAPDGSLLTVSYTHNAATVPADIGLATAWLVAAQMSDVLLSAPELRGLKQYAAGQGDLSLTFDSEASSSQAQKGLDILKLRKVMVFA